MESKRREGIIPLTQTEIMLVLATVILVLLVASNVNLSDARKQLAEFGNGPNASQNSPPSTNPDDPVTGELAPNGQGGGKPQLGKPGAGDHDPPQGNKEQETPPGNTSDSEAQPPETGTPPDAPGSPSSSQSVPNADHDNVGNTEAPTTGGATGTTEQGATTKSDEATDPGATKGSSGSGSEAPPANTPQSQAPPDTGTPPDTPDSTSSPQPGRNAGPGDGGSTEPTAEGGTTVPIEPNATPESDESSDPDVPIRPSGSESEAPPGTETSPGAGPGGAGGRVVGFDPCWRRYADFGRQYYFAYDLTFDSLGSEGSYRIVPHQDWRAGVPVVDEALRSGLAVLNEYPRGAVTPTELVKFGQRVERALEHKRNERDDDDYTSNCLLAVTLDRDAPGWVAVFVRAEVGFYPITRAVPAR